MRSPSSVRISVAARLIDYDASAVSSGYGVPDLVHAGPYDNEARPVVGNWSSQGQAEPHCETANGRYYRCDIDAELINVSYERQLIANALVKFCLDLVLNTLY